MKKFEYKQVPLTASHNYPSDYNLDAFLDTLNELGAEGWELASTLSGIFIFKRELPVEECEVVEMCFSCMNTGFSSKGTFCECQVGLTESLMGVSAEADRIANATITLECGRCGKILDELPSDSEPNLDVLCKECYYDPKRIN